MTLLLMASDSLFRTTNSWVDMPQVQWEKGVRVRGCNKQLTDSQHELSEREGGMVEDPEATNKEGNLGVE